MVTQKLVKQSLLLQTALDQPIKSNTTRFPQLDFCYSPSFLRYS
ncbi:hypothetical protein [Rubritalea tangerina]